jgi:hypothetical protein
MIVWATDLKAGKCRDPNALTDIMARCVCGRLVRFPDELARILWPLRWKARDIARTLVCVRCWQKNAGVSFLRARPADYKGSWGVHGATDASLRDLVGCYTAALWWRHIFASGCLPPSPGVDFSWSDEWDIEKIWANGISGAPAIEDVEANADEWRVSTGVLID